MIVSTGRRASCPSTHPTFNLGCQLYADHLGDHAHDVGQLVYTWINEKKENRMKWSENLKVVEVRAAGTRKVDGTPVLVDVIATSGDTTLEFTVGASNVPNFGDVLTITVEGPDHE